MVSPAQGLLMMQGGRDRTGLASLLDSVGTPGADIIAQRRADAAEQEAMDEYERREAERLAELQALIGGEEGGGEEDSGFSFGSIFRDPYTTVDEATGEITDQSKGEAYLSRGTTAAALTPALRRIVMGGKGNPYVTAGLIIPEIAYALGDYFAPETTTKIEEAVGAGYDKYVDPFVSPVTGAISDKIGEIEAGQDIQEGIFRDDLIAQGADPNSQYFDEAVRGGSMSADELAAYEEMIKNPLPDFGMADGGRVGAFSGGIMNNLLGSPQVQSMIQQYRQPTMDFSQVSSPSIPQPAVAPATPPQAYTPFVSTMPLYDPSTRGTGLPSTAGMTDPYFVYDPYSPVGAFDAPPSTAGGFLTQKQIDETFKNMDKFTLSKQKEKADAAAKAKTETRRGGGGDGKARRDKFVADRAKRAANAKIGKLDRNTDGSKPGSMGPGGGKSCFVKGTMLQMADGTEKEISTVKLGDNTKGGIVEMTMQGLPQTIYNYKGVLVSGSHWVIEDNEFVAVEDSKHGVLTDKVEPVYTLKTSEHRMWINDIEFGDFETGSDDDWEPHFEAVRKKLNEELRSGNI